MANVALGSNRAARRREAHRQAKIAQGAWQEKTAKRTSPASSAVAVAAPSPSVRLPSWITSEFSSPVVTGLCIAAIVAAVFLLVLWSPREVLSDVGGAHIAIGNFILAHHAVPRVDPFSWLYGGKPWQASEWLAECWMALVFRASGWSGLVLFAAVASASAMLIVSLMVARKLSGLPLIIALGLIAWILCGADNARPGTLAMPLLAAWAAGLIVARDHNRAPPFWLAIIMLAWVNVHGSFIAGLALIFPFAIEGIIGAAPEARRRDAIQWSLFAGVALLAALCNPYGVDAISFPIRLIGMKNLMYIEEWKHTTLADQTIPLMLSRLGVFLVVLIGVALTLPLRVAPIRALVAIGLIWMMMDHVRHFVLVAVIVPMLLAEPIAKAIDQERQLIAPRQGTAAVAGIVLLTIALIFGAVRLEVPYVREDGPGIPISALNAVPPGIRAQRVYNDMNFGNYLIGAGVAPMIDDRMELYGDSPDHLDYGFLDANDVAWTLSNPPAVLTITLDSDPHWVRIYMDQFVSVHVRKSVWDAYESGKL
jgi:hypothetical protein